jgi:hypothetical protein
MPTARRRGIPASSTGLATNRSVLVETQKEGEIPDFSKKSEI